MDIIWEELSYGFPDIRQFTHAMIWLFAAMFLGAVIGLQREKVGKPAGIKTHILAMFGTTVFVLACISYGMEKDALSRVIQGIVTGIGRVSGREVLIEQANRLAVRYKNWKLIPGGQGQKRNTTGNELGNDPEPQLFDLSKDLGEQNNIAGSNPEMLRVLSTTLQTVQGRSK